MRASRPLLRICLYIAKYKTTGTETGQLRLMPVDMREQLLPGSFEWAQFISALKNRVSLRNLKKVAGMTPREYAEAGTENLL
jgi:hypothetical protein